MLLFSVARPYDCTRVVFTLPRIEIDMGQLLLGINDLHWDQFNHHYYQQRGLCPIYSQSYRELLKLIRYFSKTIFTPFSSDNTFISLKASIVTLKKRIYWDKRVFRQTISWDLVKGEKKATYNWTDPLLGAAACSRPRSLRGTTGVWWSGLGCSWPRSAAYPRPEASTPSQPATGPKQ